jgi:hypothetical protein
MCARRIEWTRRAQLDGARRAPRGAIVVLIEQAIQAERIGHACQAISRDGSEAAEATRMSYHRRERDTNVGIGRMPARGRARDRRPWRASGRLCANARRTPPDIFVEIVKLTDNYVGIRAAYSWETFTNAA